jgi:hypothetical protein
MSIFSRNKVPVPLPIIWIERPRHALTVGRKVSVAASVLGCAALCILAGAPASQGLVRFRDVAREAGLKFILENSPTPRKHLIETMAGGVAAFDYDGDGLADLFFTNGAVVPSLNKDSDNYSNRLFRNLGQLKFRDVTREAGVAGAGFSMGVAVADYDNDGRADLFVTGVRRNILYHNRGDGTFEDVTAKSGITSGEWSVGAAWFDYDRDGKLDLFVVNYVQWTPDFDSFCGDSDRGIRVYCHPRLFAGSSNRLYHNLGNGHFEDVSAKSGVAAHIGKGMAAAVADYDRDGFMDVFVTNDKMPNFLFHNLGNGRFEEVALVAGAALPDSGNAGSSMGADFRDYNNDGLPDIAFTALSGETFPLFRNLSGGLFGDAGYTSRLGPLTRMYSGWGIGIFDFDNDGHKDIFSANSHVNDRVEAFEATKYKQHNAVFHNLGNGTFEDATQGAGSEFVTERAHRGAAFADFDNDGRMDVVVSSLGDRPELWQNISPGENTWLMVRLTGTRGNRDGIGAEVRIGDQRNHMTTSVGYASSSNCGVHFGTGRQKQVPRVEIRWPSGTLQVLENVRTNQVLSVREPAR